MVTVFLPLVPGQDLAKEVFRRALDRGRLSHAYLLIGPDGSGKRLFARELAKAIFCREGQPCGSCASCLSIEHGNHPLVHVYGPAEGKAIVDIETVRALSERTHYRSGGLVVVILEQADLLNEPAANALLKTLEEPPGDALLILTARSSGTMLPTLVSRCHRVPFTRAGSAAGLGPEPAALLREAAEPGFHAREDLRGWLARLSPGEGTIRDSVRRVLDAVVEDTRGALARSSGLPLDRELRRLETWLELRHDLDRSVNPDLVLERLLRTLG
jgi:DNA polymerase-3 subunit delta'